MFSNKKMYRKKQHIHFVIKKSSIFLFSVFLLFLLIGSLTTMSPTYRISSQVLSNWTNGINSSTFIYLFGLENRAYKNAYPDDYYVPKLSSTLFEIATSIKPDDPRSLLGNELPGFSIFDNQILIAGEGTDYTNLPVESSPPIDEVLKDRDAIVDEVDEDSTIETDDKEKLTTGKRDVVFIYNTHNRESFLPHLPDVTDPNLAHHQEVNVMKISERFAKSLKEQGIGAQVDNTDIMSVLKDKGWDYPKSYQASREVIETALATNGDIQYIIDIHRDALSRDHTTKEINGVPYAKIMMVVGADHPEYEKNLDLATKIHYLMEEKYPGLSRGVYPQSGAANNGIFNQDLMENALLIEVGGVENTLKETYRTADALAEVFSSYYWDAEKVNTSKTE